MSQTILEQYLNYLKRNFNVKKASMADYNEYVKLLDAVSKDTQDVVASRRAEELMMKLKPNKAILDIDNMNDLFINATTDDNLETVYKATDKLIIDIKHARKWLDSYKDFLDSLNKTDNASEKQGKLEFLGKAILGRSLELCPILTGYLRSSAVLKVGRDYFEIEYTAPYATYVHDNMLVGHAVGQAKFLEQAAQEFLVDQVVWCDSLENNTVALRVEWGALEPCATVIHYGYND